MKLANHARLSKYNVQIAHNLTWRLKSQRDKIDEITNLDMDYSNHNFDIDS